MFAYYPYSCLCFNILDLTNPRQLSNIFSLFVILPLLYLIKILYVLYKKIFIYKIE